MRALEIESWLPPEKAPSEEFCTTPEFVRTLECAILATRLMEAQLLAEPQLRWSRTFGFVSALRVGGLHVAVVKLASPNSPAIEGARYDSFIVSRWLETMGRVYAPLGMEVSDNFKRLMVEAGIGTDAGEEVAPGAWSETAMDLDKWVRPFVR